MNTHLRLVENAFRAGPEHQAERAARSPDYALLAPGSREDFKAHLLRLNTEDRRRRFCRTLGDDGVSAVVDDLDPTAPRVGAYVDGVLRGVAELYPPAGAGLTTRPAEVSLTVESAYQRRGIGTQLLKKTLKLAANRFVSDVVLISLPGNEPLKAVAARFGARTVLEDGDLVLHINPGPISVWTLMGEARLAARGAAKGFPVPDFAGRAVLARRAAS
ncbi:MAG: GNAT family N-acetyltransferase [Hyphomicrobiaceae bacterium]|nr:GNAT family N-acetyltransferase [Hyphomicrobiaceae bacterium]